MTDFNKISYEEDWHQGLVAEKLNQLVVELNDKVGSGLDVTFSPNADWLQGRMYLPYNVLTDYLKGNHGYVDEFGGVGAYADWHQSNIQERVNIVGSLIENIPGVLSFTSQPQSQTVDEYSTATFSCTVTGGVAPYSYQWKNRGITMGTNSPNVSFAASAADNGASITATVTDSAGVVITSSAAILSVTSYAYQLDSLTSKFILSSAISVAIGDKITVNLICSPSTITGPIYSRFVGSEDYTITVDTGISGNKFRLLGCTAKLGGVPIVSDVTPIPTDLVARDLEITLTQSGTIAAIAGLKETSGRSINAKMRYLSFTRAAGNRFIPLNKVSQGAIQLPTVGTISASILNYNPAGWVVV